MMYIIMCSNTTCPSKKDCHRFTTECPPERQVYGEFAVKEGEDKCENFYPNAEYKLKYKKK